jgi:polysaccharide export outer membrane protein
LVRFLATAQSPTVCADYRVMPPDVLSVTAAPTEEYANLTVRLGPDGKAFLPLVGTYDFANKTTTQIAAELTEKLRDYYEDVQVTVAVQNYQSQKFYVFGEVSRPGVYAFTGSDSVVSALAAAQPTRLAAPEKICLIRGLSPMPGTAGVEVDASGNVMNKTQKITINLWQMARDGRMSANVTLADNDVIYVPANPMAQVGLALQNLLLPANPVVQVAHLPADTVGGVQPEPGK